MSEGISTTQSAARMIDATLVALGFTQADDGTLIAPAGSVTSFTPIGQFFELRIVSDTGVVIAAVLARNALKVMRSGSCCRA